MNYKFYILHGWAYSTEKWQPFVNLLKQKGINPILLKIPGLTEKLDKVWGIDNYVEWLRNKIARNPDLVDRAYKTYEVVASQGDPLRSYCIVLLGHSNGGRIALNFAIKYPQTVAQLILIDSAGVYHDDLTIRFKRYAFKHIAEIGKKLSSSEKLRNLLHKLAGESDYKNANLNMRQTMINLINSDKKLHLDKVTVPSLIIWGEDDKVTPHSDGKIINKLIKNSKLHVIKGSKHSPQFTNAKEVVDVILKYLKSQNANLKTKFVDL